MEPLLELAGIVKTFPGVRALDGVHLSARAGEVHCLLGQNGAGKSTLIKVLAGVHKPDAGTITWQGSSVHFAHPQAATKAGIATIYQELDLVDGLTVADNIFLGHWRSSFGFIRSANAAAASILERLGHPLDVTAQVGDLSHAEKQVVSMARALSYDAKLIVMDEPSAVLAHDEVANLFRVIRDLTAQGVAVVYISHRLEEIREIGDRVTVLKDGRTSASGLDARITPARALISHMTGRDIEYVFPPRVTRVLGEPLITEPITVHSGEIVGIAGLVGSGRSELLHAIYGNPAKAVRAGLGLTPEERKSQALILHDPVWRNITLASFSRYAVSGLTRAGAEKAAAADIARQLDLRPPDITRPVATLSGGNQQKAVLGRWLLGGTKLLLLDEPTRGVDVGARTELYQLIHRLADAGMGVLFVSSEVPEVLGLADRVLVMRAGEIIHSSDASELDEHTVLNMIMEEQQ